MAKSAIDPATHHRLPTASRAATEHTVRFGALIRERRKSMRMTQDELALATGLGRRFIIDLESGKPTSQLGRALLAAEAVGLRVLDLLEEDRTANALLPDIPPDESLPP
jgi:transcriptional regulator with XRE-family HTH domain